MSYQPIENYGVIGDLQTVALVGVDGSIDFMCAPRFDSASVFAALLDDERGGRFLNTGVGQVELFLPRVLEEGGELAPDALPLRRWRGRGIGQHYGAGLLKRNRKNKP